MKRIETRTDRAIKGKLDGVCDLVDDLVGALEQIIELTGPAPHPQDLTEDVLDQIWGIAHDALRSAEDFT
ncbi:MAG: hypothetical protein JRD89_02825 [Deltaproteobacteria bacterium]|nr:hypothetical protein [Deltaproteobacteria bacterium]